MKVGTVIGFPLGATLASVKRFEAAEALKLGAAEIDMVQNIGALKSGNRELVSSEIRALAELAHERGALLKVILEMGLLTDEEKVIACELSEQGWGRLRENIHRISRRRGDGGRMWRSCGAR